MIWNPEGGCEFAFSIADLHPNDEQSQDDSEVCLFARWQLDRH